MDTEELKKFEDWLKNKESKELANIIIGIILGKLIDKVE